jgi:hypothetical protein
LGISTVLIPDHVLTVVIALGKTASISSLLLALVLSAI